MRQSSNFTSCAHAPPRGGAKRSTGWAGGMNGQRLNTPLYATAILCMQLFASVPAPRESATSAWMRGGRGGRMSIDRQRIAAVKQLEALGYRFDAIEWKAPEGVA